jgi:hypothetical protein
MSEPQEITSFTIAGKTVFVEIVPSAFKHGKSEADIMAVLNFTIFDETLEVDPNKTLAIGFGSNGNPVEVMFHKLSDESIVVFHAMSCRKVYLDKVLKR